LVKLKAKNEAAVVPALQSLRPSLVVAVDCGGDVLSGGLEGEKGRDRQALHCLQVSGIPFVTVVMGPGCDGETSEQGMRDCCAKLHAEGALLGAISLVPMLSDMRECCLTLKPTRTPNLMYGAYFGDLKPVARKGREYVPINRGRNTSWVPRDWLAIGLVIRHTPNASTLPPARRNI